MTILRPEPKQKMNESARRVFAGKVFDVWQWDQAMYDGSVKTFEKLKRADTTRVIPITKEGKILMAKENQPGKASFIGSFGGRIEDDEDAEAATRRELVEETGYAAKHLTLWKSLQTMSKIDWAVYVFIAHDCEKVKEQELDGGEQIEILEVDFDEFLNYARNREFAEVEILPDMYEALLDETKYQELKKLFYPESSH